MTALVLIAVLLDAPGVHDAWDSFAPIAIAGAQDERRVLAELESAELQVAAITEQVHALQTREEALATTRMSNEATLAAAELDVHRRAAAARDRAGALYRLKRHGLARLVFGADDPATLRRRVHYLRTVLTTDETRTRQLADALEVRRAANERVAADARLTAELRTELETRLAELELRRDAQKRLLREIRSRNELATSAVREREESAVQLTATAQAEARAARAQPLGMPDDVEPRFRAARGRLPAPVNGRSLRAFGPYNDPLTGAPVQNHGVDIAATVGSPIRAVFDGVVSRAGYVRGFGQVVTVQHGAYATLYAHANGLRVATGDAVRAGDVLGNVGTTGLTDDSVPRLHFEVRYNGTAQDPAEWLAHEP